MNLYTRILHPLEKKQKEDDGICDATTVQTGRLSLDSAPLIVHRDSCCLLHLSGVDCKNAPGDVKKYVNNSSETSFCACGQNCCFFDSPASPAVATFPRQCTRLTGEWRVVLDHRPSTLLLWHNGTTAASRFWVPNWSTCPIKFRFFLCLAIVSYLLYKNWIFGLGGM